MDQKEIVPTIITNDTVLDIDHVQFKASINTPKEYLSPLPINEATMQTISKCAICNKDLNTKENTISISSLKPRFIRQLKDAFSVNIKNMNLKICSSHLNQVLQIRIDKLLEQDQSSFSNLQEDAMKQFEQQENITDKWQDQFENKRKFSQKAADLLALHVGSWFFVIGVLAFIFSWGLINLLLSNPWDQFPFILLNLILSTIAAVQGPVSIYK